MFEPEEVPCRERDVRSEIAKKLLGVNATIDDGKWSTKPLVYIWKIELPGALRFEVRHQAVNWAHSEDTALHSWVARNPIPPSGPRIRSSIPLNSTNGRLCVVMRTCLLEAPFCRSSISRLPLGMSLVARYPWMHSVNYSCMAWLRLPLTLES